MVLGKTDMIEALTPISPAPKLMAHVCSAVLLNSTI